MRTTHLKACRKPALRTAVRFGAVGAAGVLVNVAALHVLYRGLGLPLVAAGCLATEVAILNNFVLNNRWTFGLRRVSLSRLLKFNATSLVSGVLSVAILTFLVHRHVGYLLADVIGVTIASVANFGVSTGWVWSVKKDQTRLRLYSNSGKESLSQGGRKLSGDGSGADTTIAV